MPIKFDQLLAAAQIPEALPRLETVAAFTGCG